MSTQPRDGAIQIDIVSDVVCPWCIVGLRHLEQALAQLSPTPAVALRWRPFELNPHMPTEGQDLREHLRDKYGTSVEQSQAARQRLTALGESLGFSSRFADDSRIYNTFKAHQLLHWAGELGEQTPLKLALFEAYFTRQEKIDDIDVLVAAAAAAGLDAATARALLDDERYADAVRKEQGEWLAKGVRAVPAFIFDDSYLVSGAQPPQAFVGLLTKLVGERAA